MKDKLKNKVVFFDFDGVLCSYQAGKNTVHIPETDYLRNHIDDQCDPYEFSKAPKTFQDIIAQLDANKTFVLTVCKTSFEYANKIKFIKDKYPSIPEGNILFVAEANFKLPLIEALYSNYFQYSVNKSDIVLVDDTINTLFDVEDAGYTCYHNSSFIP